MAFRIISDPVIYFLVHQRIFAAKQNLRDGCLGSCYDVTGEVDKRHLEGVNDNVINSYK